MARIIARSAGSAPGVALSTVISLLFVVMLVGCGNRSENDASSPSTDGPSASTAPIDRPAEVDGFCDLVQEWAQVNAELDDGDSLAVGSRLNLLERNVELFELVPDAAPLSLRPSMQTVVDVPPNSVRASELAEREVAAATIDEFVLSNCDVVFPFDRLDFTPAP